MLRCSYPSILNLSVSNGSGEAGEAKSGTNEDEDVPIARLVSHRGKVAPTEGAFVAGASFVNDQTPPLATILILDTLVGPSDQRKPLPISQR